MKDIKKKTYEKYQMHWMLAHGITIARINKEADVWLAEQKEHLSDDEPFSDYLENNGFGGSLWVCYDEFLGCEYQNREYMRFLLAEDEWERYLEDIGDGYLNYIDAWNLIAECIKAGVLWEMDSHIFIVRETGWYLEPKERIAKELMYDKKRSEILIKKLIEKKEEIKDDTGIPGETLLS